MPEEQEKTYPEIDLSKLSQEMLIGIVNNMAFRFSEDVDAEAQALISDSYQSVKDNAPNFHIEVDAGRTGYCGDYKTLEEGLNKVASYVADFPRRRISVHITPLNN
jgi:hypothetical protein